MVKTFILDTNVLLTDPDSLFAFDDNEVVLPFTTIEELDKIKSRPNEVGANAREVARRLSEMISGIEAGSLKKGLELKNGGILRIVAVSDFKLTEKLGGDWDATNKDNHILDVCRGLAEEHKRTNKLLPVLVTRDILLQVKCDFLGIPFEDYKKMSVAENSGKIFTGITSADVPVSVVQKYWEAEGTQQTELSYDIAPHLKTPVSPNEFVILKDAHSIENPVLRFVKTGEPLKIVKEYKTPIFNITPRNREQTLALDLLLDPDVKLVTLIGKAGCGKTLLSLAAGLNQVIEKKKYKTLFVCRPVVPVGNDIGFLPGPQPLTAKILTPSGWTNMGNIKAGDSVISRNGKSSTVLQTFDKGLREVCEVKFEDGSVVECCEEHLWETYKPHEVEVKHSKTRTTRQIKQDIETNKQHLRHFIDFVEPVEYLPTVNPLPVHPYVLGTILGDGCLTQKYSIELSSGDQEIVDKINRLLPNELLLRHKHHFSYSFIMKENAGRKHRKTNSLYRAIGELGLQNTNSKTKFIPGQYLTASTQDRLDLLQGLMDTDGFVSADGTDVSFTSISKRLAENVKELVLSLGGFANIKYYENKSKSYTVSVSFWNKELCPVSLTRKASRYKHRSNKRTRRIVSIHQTGRFEEMKCILIDNPEHLYITNDFVITHNTKEEKLEPWIAPIKDNLRYLLFSGKKNKGSEMSFQQFFDDGLIEVEAITYLRGRSIANAFIIIDEAQNLTAHELKTIITRVGENTKIVLTGDVEQIDNIYIDSVSNGLTVAVEKFRPYGISGHITLVKGERSELATLASKIL